MNNLVKWQCEFSVTVLANKELIPNYISCEIYFSSHTEDVIIQNIGFERIKYFMYELAQHSVIVSKSNKLCKNFIKNLESNIIALPIDPDDQVLLWCLYKKLDKILGGNFNIENMTLQSAIGENVQYHYDGSTNGIEGLDDKWTDGHSKYDFWYNRSDTATYDYIISDHKTKKIYTGKQDWDEINLGWQTETEFLAKIKKNKTQQAKIIKPKKFQIKVLDGKK
jgi:hypothetical protein